MKWRFIILILLLSMASIFSGCEADVSVDGENHNVVISEGNSGVFGASTWGNANWGK